MEMHNSGQLLYIFEYLSAQDYFHVGLYQILSPGLGTCYSEFIFYHEETIRILGRSIQLSHLSAAQINLFSRSLCIFQMINCDELEVISSFNSNIGNT